MTDAIMASSIDLTTSSSSTVEPSPSFNSTQLAFFQAIKALFAEATADGSVELTPLKQLLELSVHQKDASRSHTDTVTVLRYLLPDLASRLQSYHQTKVKAWLLEYLEQLMRLDPSAFIPETLNIVTSMTAEENLGVVKKVLSISISLFPQVYSWLSNHSSSWGVVHEHMSRTVEQLKNQLIGLWGGPSEAIKPTVIHFMQVVILTLTNEKPNPPRTMSTPTADKKEELRPFSLKDLSPDHPVLTQAKLKQDVQGVLAALFALTPATATTWSSLLKTFSTLCKQRSLQLSDRIVGRLIEVTDLILMEEAQLQLLPSEQQVARVKKDLQACLLEVLKSLHFSLPNYEEQQTALVRGLTALGSEGQTEEVVRAQSTKRAEFLKQQPATVTRVEAQPPVPPQQQPRPYVLPLQTLMYQLDELSRLPHEYVVALVINSLQQFVVPPSSAASYASTDPSPVFLEFLEACLTAQFNDVRADTPQEQRQQFEHVASIIRAHSTEAINTLFPPLGAVPTSTAIPTAPTTPVAVRTVVPPVPIPEVSQEGYEKMSRSAFTRIASNRTAAAVERSGESMLRNVILAKLSTTNLLHPREYVHIVNPELDPSDPHASEWQSSLLQSDKGVLPLRAYISGRLQDSTPGSYEGVLNVLYSLLCIDTSQAVIQTRIKEKEIEEMPTMDEAEEYASGQYNTGMGDEGEEGEGEGGENEQKSEQPDTEMSDATTGSADATKAGTKRKRQEDESTATDAANGTTDEQPDTKRSKSETTTTASSEDAQVVPVVATPSTLPDFSKHGTIEYGEVLDMLLDELREGSSGEGRQQLYRRFLLDIPLLTPRVFASLDDWIYDPARSVIGLSALRDLILYRPPVRQTSLELLLGYTHKPQLPQLRNQAIRLVVNHLYQPNAHLRAPILAHAIRMLDALTNPDQILADLPEIIVNVIVPPVPVYDQIELEPRKAEKPPQTPVLTATDSNVTVKQEPGLPSGSPALVAQPSTEADRRAAKEAADLKTRQEIANMIADADRRKKKFDRLVFLRELREKEKKLMEQQREERQKRRVDRIVRHMELYLSLCVHEPHMLQRIFQVYGQSNSEFVKKCIHDQMPRIVRVLMRLSPEGLIRVLEEVTLASAQPTSTNSEPLVLLCLQLMTASAPPTQPLVQCVTRMYQAKLSPRYLVPVLSGLPVDAIRRYLPKLITLPVDELSGAFKKLLHSKPPSSIKPSELLVALHLITPEPRKRVGTAPLDPVQLAKERKEDEEALDKRVIAATKLCFDDPESFPPEVLGVVLSQLSDHTPLPKLLMRTVMQSMMLHSSLKSFVVSNLLIKLINRHIYLNPTLWDGFLRTGNMLLPQSIPILIQLPDQPFMNMMTNPLLTNLQQQLIHYIQNFPLQVRRSIRELVQQMMQERLIQQQTDAMRQQQQQQHTPQVKLQA